MIKNQKFFFLYALILTLVIFNLGIFMGYMLESSRVNKINTLYLQAEAELLNQQLIKDSSQLISLNCSSMISENIEFANQVFNEALLIQQYEKANRMNTDIIFEHKRFDLLRTLFWMNSIRIKQQCNANYHDLVYFYKYNSPSVEQNSKQDFFSKVLEDVKRKEGDNVMLIPIAGDNGLSSISLLMEKFGIKEEDLPVILIDEKTKLTEVSGMDDIEKYLI